MSCGQAIPPTEAHLKCPRCGSADRNVEVADYAAAVDELTGLAARFTSPPAAWQQMWAEVRQRLDIVRGWYSAGGPAAGRSRRRNDQAVVAARKAESLPVPARRHERRGCAG